MMIHRISGLFLIAVSLLVAFSPTYTSNRIAVSPPEQQGPFSGGKPAAPSRVANEQPVAPIDPHGTDARKIIAFAETLKGVPYKYGSTDPAQGFDCSGFITYVFNHFGITVPRTSESFTHAGKEVPLRLAEPGDLILFTGTDSTVRVVGHMGIVVYRKADSTAFIHSTSGKAYGVTETPLNRYYQGRFVKVIRVFN